MERMTFMALSREKLASARQLKSMERKMRTFQLTN
jgi:hypothetical protein